MSAAHSLQGKGLVFVHGAGSNADFWYRQRDTFPDAHYLTLPGHDPVRGKGTEVGGRSSANFDDSRRTIEGYTDWVARYVEREGLHDVVLNGHSMGGAITLTLALRHPTWLKAVALTGTGARLRVLPQLLDLLQIDYPAAVSLIVQESFAPQDAPPTYRQKAVLDGTRRQILRVPQQITYADYAACNSFDVMQSLSQIKLPCLCIVGAQDKMTPPRYSEYLHEQIAGSQLEKIEGAGHMLPLEQPEEYNRRLGRFVAGLP